MASPTSFPTMPPRALPSVTFDPANALLRISSLEKRLAALEAGDVLKKIADLERRITDIETTVNSSIQDLNRLVTHINDCISGQINEINRAIAKINREQRQTFVNANITRY